MLPNEFIAVTGTNGKTTTVELVGHIHREAGLPVAVAGNVGAALSGLVGRIDERVDDRLRGVLLPAGGHARVRARGGGAAEPRARPPRPPRHARGLPAAKLEIFARPGAEDVAVVPARVPARGPAWCGTTGELRQRPRCAALRARRDALLAGASAARSRASCRCAGATTCENAMAAAAVCLARGIDLEAVRAGLRSFAGVPHRLEEIASRDGVAVCQRLQGHERREHAGRARGVRAGTAIHLILGGRARDRTSRGCAGRSSALPGRVSDRRRRPAIARALGGSGAGARVRRAGACACRRAAAAAVPARWSCSRRPARASTSSSTSKIVASASASSSGAVARGIARLEHGLRAGGRRSRGR